jgi:hypothetical protein
MRLRVVACFCRQPQGGGGQAAAVPPRLHKVPRSSNICDTMDQWARRCDWPCSPTLARLTAARERVQRHRRRNRKRLLLLGAGAAGAAAAYWWCAGRGAGRGKSTGSTDEGATMKCCYKGLPATPASCGRLPHSRAHAQVDHVHQQQAAAAAQVGTRGRGYRTPQASAPRSRLCGVARPTALSPLLLAASKWS